MEFDSLKISANQSNKKSADGFDPVSAYESYKPVTATKTSTVKAVSKSSESAKTSKYTEDEVEGTYDGKNYEEKLSNAIDAANEKLRFVKTSLNYRVHEETNQIIVQVKNSETDEVIREIPSEKNLDMLAKMRELAGIMVDEKR